MKARHFVVLLAAILAAMLCGAASAEGQPVACEADGYKVSLEIPSAWESMAEGGEVQSDGSVLIGQWGVFSADDDLTMVMITAADIWQEMTSERRQELVLRTKGDCDTAPDTVFGNALQTAVSAQIGVDIPYEEIGGIWYLKYVGVYESTGKDGRAVSADRIYFSCIRDGIQYNIAFFYPDFDARAEAEMVAVMESIRYAAKTEYAFDLFSIDMPDNLVVFTKDNVEDESLYTGIYQGYQEYLSDLFTTNSNYYLLAYEPESAYELSISVYPIGNWYDLNAASADQIENEIIPPYISHFEESGGTVSDSGFCLLGDQTYLSFRRSTPDDGQMIYDIRYVTMVQVKGYLYSVAITAVSYDVPMPEEAVDALTEAIRSMTYFGTEGTRVTNVDDGYAMTVQVPITWVNLGELDTEREEDDDSVHWGAIEDGVRSMVFLEADPYWSEMTSAQKSEEGFLTKYDCEMIPGTEPGDGYFNTFKGGGNYTEYLEYGGVWYIRHDIAAEGAPGQVMPCISLFMTIHEGTYFTLTFIYDAFTPECEAEMNRIMESVTYQEME